MSSPKPIILIVSENKADVAELKACLMPVLAGSYSFNHCSSLHEVFSFFKRNADSTSAVILVLINDQQAPVDCFDTTSLKKLIGHVPVISLVEANAQEMECWRIDQGVLEFLTTRPFSKDAGNLGAAIEMAILLDKISSAASLKNQAHLRRVGKKCARTARKTAEKSALHALDAQKKINADKLNERDEIIFWMSGGYSVNKPM